MIANLSQLNTPIAIGSGGCGRVNSKRSVLEWKFGYELCCLQFFFKLKKVIRRRKSVFTSQVSIVPLVDTPPVLTFEVRRAVGIRTVKCFALLNL
jgi:hypothetical protein